MKINVGTYSFGGIASYLGLGMPLREKFALIRSLGFDEKEFVPRDVLNTISRAKDAMTSPEAFMAEAEKSGDFTARQAWSEAAKTLPWGAVWQYFCAKHNLPSDFSALEDIRRYERTVLARRG